MPRRYPHRIPPVTAARDEDLADLRYHWGSAYDIRVTEAGIWRAIRRDNGRTIVTACAGDLHTLVVADYVAEPVKRGDR